MKFDIRPFLELWLHLYFSRSNHANHVVADFHGVHLGTPQEPEKDRKRNSRSNSKSSSQSSPSYGCTVKGRKVRSLIHNHTTFTTSFHHSTMLQKLSKCEVKAWLCWDLIILPPLRFYVKSNFVEFRRFKNVIFGNFRGSQFGFYQIWATSKSQNLPKIQSSESLKWPKVTFLSVKWSTFNKVKP